MLTSPTGTFDLFVTTDSDSFINVIVAGPVLWIQKNSNWIRIQDFCPIWILIQGPDPGL